jgi:opacity protein-like surface antigen
MKKLLVTLFLVSLMVFALAAGAMASSVYVDGLVSSKLKLEATDPDSGITASVKTDYKSYALGTNINSGSFLFNLEYAKNTVKAFDPADPDTDSDTINFKCGYTLFGDEQSYLALTAGYHQMKMDVKTDDKYSGVIIGLNATSNLSEKSLLEGFLGYSVSGTYKYQDQDTNATIDTDIDILLLQVKYSYFFTENFGLGIGYKLTQYKGEDDSKITTSGPTVGLTYKF